MSEAAAQEMDSPYLFLKIIRRWCDRRGEFTGVGIGAARPLRFYPGPTNVPPFPPNIFPWRGQLPDLPRQRRNSDGRSRYRAKFPSCIDL